MTGRVRKPTARALDAAESRLLLASSSSMPSRPSSTSSSHAPSAAPVKRKGRAVNDKGKQAIALQQHQAQQAALVAQQLLVDPEGLDLGLDADASTMGDGEQDLTLYCICLGYDTGEQPMIQCEHCSNWFHFSCVHLNDDLAAQIEAYSCDMCEQMGMGSTRLLPDATQTQVVQQQPLALPPSAFAFPPPVEQPKPEPARGEDGHYDLPTSDEDGDEDDEEEETDEEDEDFEEKEERRERRKKKGKRAREGDEEWGSSGDEDGGEAKAKKPPRKKRPSAPRPRGPDVKPSPSAPVQSVPVTDKTRSTVIKQLTTNFSSIFSASSGDGTSAGTDVRSAALAEEVESELFDSFAEVDKGVRAPRQKYASKFRSIAFNLKTNAVLRSRVAANELSAQKIANLSAEDLQTPELRAMAESVRAASLRNSVKEALVVPTAKRTHKGEEEIDSEATRIIAAEEAERAKEEKGKERERSESNSLAGSPAPPFPGTPTAGSPSSAPQSPSSSRDFPSGPRGSLPTSSLAFSSTFDGVTPAADASSPGRSTQHGSPAPSGSPIVEQEGDMSPPPPPDKRRSSSSFDMASIWGKVSAASPPLSSSEKMDGPMPALEDSNPDGEEEAYEPADPFSLGNSQGDDFDEDDLFRDPNASPKKKAPPPPKFEELPQVWSGDMLVPEEGGFPGIGVQVGGRPLGTAESTWRRVVPKTLTTAGRIATQQAVKYLVDCSFSPKRELVIVALLPDLSGPSDAAPHKPNAERCKAKHQHIFEVYTKRGRIGVVQPPKEVQALVKDIYIVPLAKDDPLPEYVELADEHIIPEKGRRTDNLLLAVFVVNKGILPTVKPAPPPAISEQPSFSTAAPSVPTGPKALAGIPTGPKAMQHSPPPQPIPSFASGPPSPSFSPPAPAPPGGANLDPSAVQNLLGSLNPSALSSLLANPALLGALNSPGGSANTPTPPPPMPPQHAPYGYPQQGYDQGYAGYQPPQQPMGGPQMPMQYQPPPAPVAGGGGGPPVHPSRLAMMNQQDGGGQFGPGQEQYGQQQQQQQQQGAWGQGQYGQQVGGYGQQQGQWQQQGGYGYGGGGGGY